VTSLLNAAAQGLPQPSLCLLGAGNCNDVDLRSLLSHFSRLHLVDADTEALHAGANHQGIYGHPSVVLEGAVDLRVEHPAITASQFDVVASLCVLSQLMEGALEGQNPADPAGLEAVQTLRRRHLELIVALLKPGGSGLLITDVVSSDTAPHLRDLPPEQLAGYVATCIAQRNFFTGLNPAVVLDLLQRDPWFASRVERLEPINPWKWDFGPRCYAVYALRFCRRLES
jgi:hypothetical protein